MWPSSATGGTTAFSSGTVSARSAPASPTWTTPCRSLAERSPSGEAYGQRAPADSTGEAGRPARTGPRPPPASRARPRPGGAGESTGSGSLVGGDPQGGRQGGPGRGRPGREAQAVRIGSALHVPVATTIRHGRLPGDWPRSLPRSEGRPPDRLRGGARELRHADGAAGAFAG